jgi:hypothetical protein
MNRKALLFLAIFILISCKSKKLSNCTIPYTMENLFRIKDNSWFHIKKEGKWTSVWDKGDSSDDNQERGYYSFDENHVLRVYLFLLDDSSYHFQVVFDSFGRETGKPYNNVVRWIVQKKGRDSSRVTFLVFQINRSYGSLVLTADRHSIPVTLYIDKYFSNLAGAEIIISNQSSGIIFLSGIIKDDCSGEKVKFSDSLNIAGILARRRMEVN